MGQYPNEKASLSKMSQCSFATWYPYFEKIAIRGIILNIPTNVLNYLQDELFVLPRECHLEGRCDTGWESTEECSDDEEAISEPSFVEFSAQINKSLRLLPGCCAFVKTQWHSPKDAFWITAGQTLKVTDITDVYQLLKASTIIKQDICNNGFPISLETEVNQCGAQNMDNILVLKEWIEIHPGTEFRCFVRGKKLIAISPRDWPAYHQHIIQDKYDICQDIVSIFIEKIKDFPLADYVFDVVRLAKDHVLLMDFSPFDSMLTESLAFDWTELMDFNNFSEADDPEFRYLPNDCGIQPSKRNNYGIPIDIANLFSEVGEDGARNLTNLVNQLEIVCTPGTQNKTHPTSLN